MDKICNIMFDKLKIKGSLINFNKMTTLLIDDVHLCPKTSLQNLRNLS